MHEYAHTNQRCLRGVAGGFGVKSVVIIPQRGAKDVQAGCVFAFAFLVGSEMQSVHLCRGGSQGALI